MNKPLMSKATAVWLVDNTSLTFAQIAKFCEMHERQVKGIADGDVASGMTGMNPIQFKQLTAEEIKRCEEDPNAELQLYTREDLPEVRRRAKGPRYTPMNKRNEKPNAIAWLVKNHPALSDAAIGRLLATTKDTIRAIRERTHWNIANIQPENPVLSGLCSQRDLDNELSKIRPSQQAQSDEDTASDNETQTDNNGENSENSEENNPFAVALAAYASAARQKINADSNETYDTNEGDTDAETQTEEERH